MFTNFEGVGHSNTKLDSKACQGTVYQSIAPRYVVGFTITYDDVVNPGRPSNNATRGPTFVGKGGARSGEATGSHTHTTK